jgi:hypothetical protein
VRVKKKHGENPGGVNSAASNQTVRRQIMVSVVIVVRGIVDSRDIDPPASSGLHTY